MNRKTCNARPWPHWGLNETQAKAAAHVGLPSGYANLSEKAIRNLLPHLERGLVFSDAVQAAGYAHHSDFRGSQAHERLPYYGVVLERDAIGADPKKDPQVDGEPARYGRFPNPTVHIGLNQIRRVVNRLIEVYGKPEEIVVELARDLKANREQRQQWLQRQREGRERNERYEEMLSSAEEETTPEIRRKLRLWEEQGKQQSLLCPYSGRQLSFGMVVSSQTEVDHILPFSRTLDDSPANKVVCLASANRDKGDRSPYEAFGHSPSGYDYDTILASAANLPRQQALALRAGRHATVRERRSIPRPSTQRNPLLVSGRPRVPGPPLRRKNRRPRRVRAIPGHMTAVLRRGWGLEGMLRVTPAGEIVRKQRDDHRHHAIDAFVVANTTQGLLHRFASRLRFAPKGSGRAAGRHRTRRAPLGWIQSRRPSALPGSPRGLLQTRPRNPWSKRPNHRPTAQRDRLRTGRAFGYRPVHGRGSQAIEQIEALRPRPCARRKVAQRGAGPGATAALLELWDKVGGKAAEFAQQAASEGVVLNGRRQHVRKVRVLDEQRVLAIRDRAGKPYKGYLPGGNEFADVWRMRDGSCGTIIVPTFDANQPGFDIEKYRPADRKTGSPDPAAKRIMRLHIDDFGAFGEGTETPHRTREKDVDCRNGACCA